MHDFVNEDALHERNQPRRFYKIIIPRFASLLNLDMPLSLSSKALAIDFFCCVDGEIINLHDICLVSKFSLHTGNSHIHCNV